MLTGCGECVKADKPRLVATWHPHLPIAFSVEPDAHRRQAQPDLPQPEAPMPAPRFGVYAALMALTSLVAETDAAPPTGYLKPPPVIRDVLDAPPPPTVSVSPTRDYVLLLHMIRYPALADVASPMLRLAGLRINPRTNGPHL